MNIFAAGIVTETNTFSPVPTALEDFQILRAADVRAGTILYPSLDLTKTWGAQATLRGFKFHFGLMAWAAPAGITTKRAYETLRDELLQSLSTAGSVDVVLLMLHGAMVAQGYEDCEADIIRRVRDVVGPNAKIGVELDLHCNIDEETIAEADVVIIYKEYPHTDINDRATELFNLTIDAKLGKVTPTVGLFDCQMVGMYPTSRQPMRSYVDGMIEAEKRDGILSISLAHGFHFADVRNVGVKVLVITDGDIELAQKVAQEFGRRIYRCRKKVGFDSISVPMEIALEKAIGSKHYPVVVADQSDNTGGGAPGDATFVLRWLFQHQARDVGVAILYDPEVVKVAKRAGIGAVLPVRLGGKTGVSSGDPLDLVVTVMALRENYAHALPQSNGEPWLFPAGDVVALSCEGIDIIVSSERCQCFSPTIFSDFGIDPSQKKILVPKSYQHFHSAFSAIASEIIYMAAPGAVMPDPRLVHYERLDATRLYPWNSDPLDPLT